MNRYNSTGFGQLSSFLIVCLPIVTLCGGQSRLQLIFTPQFEDGPARLRTFMKQPDIFGVASFVAKCLALFP